jgi:hypothetical protein
LATSGDAPSRHQDLLDDLADLVIAHRHRLDMRGIGKALLAGRAASVTAANAQTDAFATTAAASATTELVTQIVGIVP